MFGLALTKYLQAQGLGEYDEDGIGGDLFYIEMPNAPDAIVSIKPTGGLPDIASGTLPYDYPTIQVMVRSERMDLISGERRAWQLYDSLNGLHRLTFDPGGDNEMYVVSVKAPVPPVHIRTDSQGRDRWTLNLQAMVRRRTLIRT